ncbi:MAG: hypothetical protein QOI41_2251, partial [Myxococcales bacterium]|nr:hypothetical protein [Myxococcales bacterium]
MSTLATKSHVRFVRTSALLFVNGAVLPAMIET